MIPRVSSQSGVVAKFCQITKSAEVVWMRVPQRGKGPSSYQVGIVHEREELYNQRGQQVIVHGRAVRKSETDGSDDSGSCTSRFCLKLGLLREEIPMFSAPPPG